MSNAIKNDEYYLYKAKKYHYKIQKKLLSMKKKGKEIPDEYKQYLQDFNMLGGRSNNLSDAIEHNVDELKKTTLSSIDELKTTTLGDLKMIHEEIKKLSININSTNDKLINEKNKILIEYFNKSFDNFSKQNNDNNTALQEHIIKLINSRKTQTESQLENLRKDTKDTLNNNNEEIKNNFANLLEHVTKLLDLLKPPEQTANKQSTSKT